MLNKATTSNERKACKEKLTKKNPDLCGEQKSYEPSRSNWASFVNHTGQGPYKDLEAQKSVQKWVKHGQTITKVFPHRKPTDFRRKTTECMSFSERSIQAMVISQSIIGQPCPSSLILPMLLFIHGSFIFILAIPPQEPLQCLGFLNHRNKLYEHVQTVYTHTHLWQKTFKWKSVTCPIVYDLCTYIYICLCFISS